MMDTYGRFKLMQSLRSWLEIPTAGVQDVGSTLFNKQRKMKVAVSEYMETNLPLFGEEIDATYHDVPLSEIWDPHITHWQASSVISDYKYFIAYMRGKL